MIYGDKVEHELKQMETIGIISKVSQLTDWHAGMVLSKRNQENYAYV